jgi:GntR family transcriptional regulator / MocR family aminotransferase
VDGARGPLNPDLLVVLDRAAAMPLHEQLEQSLRQQVRSGQLAPGTRLPSTRALAAELGLSRGVVLEAYAQLTAEGYLSASQGAPTRVAGTVTAERPAVLAQPVARPHQHDFGPSTPDLLAFPRVSWMRSLRAVLRQAPFAELGNCDVRGTPQLRNELMGYLGRARGAAPEPEHVLITSGFAQAFSMLCRVLRDRGVERIALEDPGYLQHRLIAERAGLEPVAIGVDELGIDVAALRASSCEVVVVTPAHQFPTGVVLSAERRGALIEWAEDEDGLIVEDDYDSELRLDRMPVGALQGLAPERVCYVGSASKRLAPGVRLGWVLSPSWLTGPLSYEQATGDGGSPVLDQLALADFIARGELDRHLRRMRLRYRARRAAMVDALATTLPSVRAVGIPAGLFVLVVLPDGVGEDAVLTAAAARGAAVEGLAAHRLTQAGPAGLVLGYANQSEQALANGVRVLGQAVAEASVSVGG